MVGVGLNQYISLKCSMTANSPLQSNQLSIKKSAIAAEPLAKGFHGSRSASCKLIL